jgi:hypothetical protein
MVTTQRPLIDVGDKWAVDAALFLAMAAGFLLWGVIDRNPAENILSWAIMATIAMLFDRLSPILPDATPLAEARERPPHDAVRRSVVQYAAGTAAAMVVLVAALQAVFVIFFVPPGFFAGWATAYAVSRLRGLVRVRQIERATGVRLSTTLEPIGWRRRMPGMPVYYATPRVV